VPDWETLKQTLKDEGIEAEGSREELCENPYVVKRVQRDAVEFTREMNDYERVKRVYLLPREFSIDKGEMTPTLKIKRGVIDETYEEAIDEICGSQVNKQELIAREKGFARCLAKPFVFNLKHN
jgi:long-chain acyl-CoA synthetase